ncbi:MAG: hypothetical protein B6226_05010 [Candidatus Cloacimonetes bacterium 4572_65]|nr:MAG: hypothetical protein B6226_05010 [Candidatus Cloacimonetes bacterium 4572_65]
MKKEMNRRFSSFVDKNYCKMVNYAHSHFKEVADKDGEDIVQDVMLKLLNNQSLLISIENVAGYIFKAIRNKILDEVRKRPLEVVSLNNKLDKDEKIEFIDLIESKEEYFEQDYSKLHDALELLPPDQRYVIVQNVYEKQKLKDIAQELDVPIGTVLARKSRGMKRLKQMLDKGEKDV